MEDFLGWLSMVVFVLTIACFLSIVEKTKRMKKNSLVQILAKAILFSFLLKFKQKKQ